MPIFVETIIRAPLEEVWRVTQDPGLHTRWDVRFSEITYLPKTGDLQRFLYRTRLGFGLDIAGDGESRGERHASDGSRTSALRFWSSDVKSLIEEGSGYWKYSPVEGGTRFVTLYDYRTRFGATGRIVDRLVFRPLMAWATAWSFDRLRMSLEAGADPASSRDAALTHWVARGMLALIWIYQGAVPKLVYPEFGETSLVSASGMFRGSEPLVVAMLGLAEIGFGLLHFVFRRSALFLRMNYIVLLGLLAPAAFLTQHIFFTPFNAVTLTLGMAALTAIALLTLDRVPHASNTIWSWRKR